jgi:phosphatidylglycerol---prolipoprotein diacylglyceryl transferase
LLRRLRELDKPPDWSYEMAFAALVGGLVGSRLYYVIQNYSQVKHDLLGSLFSGSGLVWYGGVIGGAMAVIAWAWWRRMLDVGLLDLASVPLAMGYAIGRIGCQLSGDGDYGKVSSLPTAMSYPHGTVPTPPGVTVLPTPIYETVAMGLVAWWLWRGRDAYRPGALFAFYLLLSGLERLLIEFIRRNHRVALGMTVPQYESIALMILGIAWLALLARSGGVRLTSRGANAAVVHA